MAMGETSQPVRREALRPRCEPRTDRRRASRSEARRDTPAVPGADRGSHRRPGYLRGAGRCQAELRSRVRCDRQRVAGLLRRCQAGHHRSARRAHAGEPGPGGHAAADSKGSRPAADHRRPAASDRLVSEESCPFCAAERWPLAVALAHFGTWSHLGSTTSSATDIYPNTATLSFRTAQYSSAELTLRTTELADNTGRPLQAQTRWTPSSSTATTCPRTSTASTSPGPSRSSTSQITTSWPGAVRPAGARWPVRSPDRQPAQQPIEPGRAGSRRIRQSDHHGHRP